MKTTQTFALTAIAAVLFAGNAYAAAGAPNPPDLTGMFSNTPTQAAAQPVPSVSVHGSTSTPTPVATPSQLVLQPVKLTATGPAITVPASSVPDIAASAPGSAIAVVVQRKSAKKRVSVSAKVGSVAAPAILAPVPALALATFRSGIEAELNVKKMEPALVALNKWLGRTTGINVENGIVKFPYGMMEPVLVCAPLHVCDIELEPAEVIQNVSVGDTARWQLSPALQNTTQHIVVKPMIPEDEGIISTNAIITTSKRTYTITLKSSPTDFIPRIGFYYPQDAVQVWSTTVAVEAAVAKTDTAPLEVSVAQVDMAKVNLEYSAEGDDMLKPSKIFDDGKRLFLQMPDVTNDLPAVMVDNHIVNYRYRDGFYVIDMLGNKTTLLIGVGREQRKVEITKGRRALLFGIF